MVVILLSLYYVRSEYYRSTYNKYLQCNNITNLKKHYRFLQSVMLFRFAQEVYHKRPLAAGFASEILLSIQTQRTRCPFESRAVLGRLFQSGRQRGRENEFKELFDPSRSILHPQLFVNGFEAVVNLLTPSKKLCPHMGCALKYNAAERSWDCPCHGSRFSESGELLENPANSNLNRR